MRALVQRQHTAPRVACALSCCSRRARRIVVLEASRHERDAGQEASCSRRQRSWQPREAPTIAQRVAAAALAAIVMVASPPAVSEARAAETFFDEVHDNLAALELPTTEDQERLRTMIANVLRDMMAAADNLSGSTGRLLSFSAQAAQAGELYDGQRVVEVALRMSEDALLLAQEASQLAALDQVPEAERQLAYQIEEAARLVSTIARELAAQQGKAEALGLDAVGAVPEPPPPPPPPPPEQYYYEPDSSSTSAGDRSSSETWWLE